jgi:hypothetical protein
MLNPITFSVEGESGPLLVTANGLDYAAYEDQFDRAVINDISAGRYKCWLYLVWHAMHRQGMTDKSFDDFLADAPSFGAPERIEDVPPLESQPPTGS